MNNSTTTPNGAITATLIEADYTGCKGVYLVHFDTPYHHARHYLGYADDIAARLKEHRAGRGSRLCAVVRSAGIDFTFVRFWRGGRRIERKLKNQHSAPRLCPICRAQAQK